MLEISGTIALTSWPVVQFLILPLNLNKDYILCRTKEGENKLTFAKSRFTALSPVTICLSSGLRWTDNL